MYIQYYIILLYYYIILNIYIYTSKFKILKIHKKAIKIVKNFK